MLSPAEVSEGMWVESPKNAAGLAGLWLFNEDNIQPDLDISGLQRVMDKSGRWEGGKGGA